MMHGEDTWMAKRDRQPEKELAMNAMSRRALGSTLAQTQTTSKCHSARSLVRAGTVEK